MLMLNHKPLLPIIGDNFLDNVLVVFLFSYVRHQHLENTKHPPNVYTGCSWNVGFFGVETLHRRKCLKTSMLTLKSPESRINFESFEKKTL